MKSDELLLIIKAAELVNSNVQLEEVLKNIVEVATDLTNADRGTLYIVDKPKGELRSLVAMGDELKEIKLKMGEGLAGHVAESGEILNIIDVRGEEKFNPEFDRMSGYTTKSMLCFPLKNREDEIVGVLQLLNSKHDKFSVKDEGYLQALSIHAALALNNAVMHQAQIESKKEVERMNKELVSVNDKLEKFALQKSHFLSQMSHEIKTPLNIIMGSSQLLQLLNASKQYEELTEAFESLDSGSQRLLRTVNEIIELSRLNSGGYEVRKESLHLEKEIVTPILNKFKTVVEEKGIELNYEKKTKKNKITGDRFMVHQILMEIIDNAVKFTTSGGVYVKQFTNGDNALLVSIKDTGEGISHEYINHIFEPFSQEHTGYTRKYEGSGLALALVKQYADLNKINVSVHSEKNIGSEVVLTFH